MAKDPAFLFYPGDWLGGTMGMTLEQKGAYLELLILQFNNGKFTKAQAKQVLSICFDVAWPMLELKFSTDGNFFWNQRLGEEIEKRKNYTNSRRINALSSKDKKHMHKHMENENENENESKKVNGNIFGKSENLLLIPEMYQIFKTHNPNYPGSTEKDYKPLYSLATYFCEQGGLSGSPDTHRSKIIEAWEPLCKIIKADKFYSQKSLSTISNHIQEILQIAKNGKSTGKPDYGSKERAKEYDRLFAERYGNGGSTVG
jgi:uncharacterized protein YdaU (DUF1376 family)